MTEVQWVSVIAPERPPNGGDVPITITSRFPQQTDQFIKTHHLIVDENPSPVAAKYFFITEKRYGNRINSYSCQCL